MDNLKLDWEYVRELNKETRKEETDIIKDFINLAKSQGSKNSEWYYKHFSKLIINKLGLSKDINRDKLTKEDLINITYLEDNIRSNVSIYMDAGYNYKDIYKEVKNIINDI